MDINDFIFTLDDGGEDFPDIPITVKKKAATDNAREKAKKSAQNIRRTVQAEYGDDSRDIFSDSSRENISLRSQYGETSAPIPQKAKSNSDTGEILLPSGVKQPQKANTRPAPPPVPKKEKPSKEAIRKRKRKALLTFLSLFLVFALLIGALFIYSDSLLNALDRLELNHDNLELTGTLKEEDYKNIAVFGIDSRADSFEGRSDSIIIVSIDRVHSKIKLTTIARDTYVDIDGHGKDKITHAYMYGGAELAVKTLNQNFDLNITDYATANFYGMVEIVDEIGGVELDVDSQEKYTMNVHYAPELNSLGLTCELITETGLQRLSGAQALAYARNRYSSGGDVERGNRQKEVLVAIYKSLTGINITQLNDLVKILLKNCQTSLGNDEIVSLATWAATKTPSIESLSLPDADCNPKSGDAAMINGVWYYIYDLEIAKQKIFDFLHEEDTYTLNTMF